MKVKAIVATCLIAAACVAMAEDKQAKKEETAVPKEKEVSGMSIVGNNETPKSLIIIPWKSSEIGQETSFSSSLLNQEIAPVDKPSFLREVEFYKISNPN